MLQNYLKTALRYFARNKLYTTINVAGLAFGLAISLMILVYVQHEYQYDKFHAKKDRIFRLSFTSSDGTETKSSCISIAPMGPALQQDLPEIVDFTRVSGGQSKTFSYEDKSITTNRARYADSSLFRMFDFSLAQGSEQHALRKPHELVLSKDQAAALFGEQNPIGKQVLVDDSRPYTVVGVLAEAKGESHLQFDALLSFATLYTRNDVFLDWNGGWSYRTYLELSPESTQEATEAKFEDFFYDYLTYRYEEVGWTLEGFLQPLPDIYLKSELDFDEPNLGNQMQLYLYLTIAFLILIIAGINYMNLNTAHYMKRTKEVGLRKVAGAHPHQLIRQFLGESLLLSAAAFVLSLIILELLLPYFAALMNTNLTFYQASQWPLFLGIPLLVIFIALISGLYPAYISARVNPGKSLKGEQQASGKMRLSTVLVIAQFAVSALLFTSITVIYSQLHYMQNKSLGFQQEQIITIPLNSKVACEKCDLLRSRVAGIAGIKAASVASNYPGRGLTSNGYVPEGKEKPVLYNALYVDPHYQEVFGLEIVEGRFFREDRETDNTAYLINETLAKQLPWDNPLGHTINRNGNHEIIGVVKDFHFSPLREQIAPLIFTQQPRPGYLMARLTPGNTKATTKQISAVWKEVVGTPLQNYTFVDETLNHLYAPDMRFAQLLLFFCLVAILIAAMGLFGLTSLHTARRKREMAIRKVLGAKAGGLMLLLAKRYLLWIVIANLIAWPAAWYASNQWLMQFVYRISLHPLYFFSALAVLLLIALFTIFYHTLRTIRTQPAHALRHE
ncbi:MAG: ABC transporter permease [Bacteroidota bacterium]